MKVSRGVQHMHNLYSPHASKSQVDQQKRHFKKDVASIFIKYCSFEFIAKAT